MRVLHHKSGIQPDKIMLSDIIGKVSQNECSLLGLIYRGAVYFDVVGITVNVNLLLLVVDDVC